MPAGSEQRAAASGSATLCGSHVHVVKRKRTAHTHGDGEIGRGDDRPLIYATLWVCVCERAFVYGAWRQRPELCSKSDLSAALWLDTRLMKRLL